MASLKMRYMPSELRSRNPPVMIARSASLSTFFPWTISMIWKARYPPSSAGSGRMFTIARFRLMSAANWYRPLASFLATSLPAARIATGPETFLDDSEKLVTNWNSPLQMFPSRNQNSLPPSTNWSAKPSGMILFSVTFGARLTPIRPVPSGISAGAIVRFSTLAAAGASTSLADADGAPRSTSSASSFLGLTLTRSINRSTDDGSALISSPPIFVTISPFCSPARSATVSGLITPRMMPGEYVGSVKPTTPTCTMQMANAATMFAATPAQVTMMRSNTGLFVNRLGSSFSYGQSSSSSGNATYPPSGMARSENSTELGSLSSLYFQRMGPNPTANFLT
mmetsp:Transcript_4584/g.12993  ORF Transcript_4584/g.12993 Transcript_4584/m.12993 type:complete len:339 (-) Transcript_4584:366-1382(-)